MRNILQTLNLPLKLDDKTPNYLESHNLFWAIGLLRDSRDITVLSCNMALISGEKAG
jgi:hypothetical protein